MGDFKELKVWQKSKDLSVRIYKLFYGKEIEKVDFRLKSQITSSAISIPSNIAEGDELNTIKQGIKHLYIAKGSCAELITQLIICKEIGILKTKEADDLIEEAELISLMLYKLIQARIKFLN